VDEIGFFNIALARPDDLALVDAHRRLTWAELDARVNQVGRLLQQAGLGPGDHAAMVMGNRSEFVEVLGACLKTGVIVTPVNWHFTPDEVAYVVEDCGARTLIVDEDYAHLATVAAETTSPALALVTGQGPAGMFAGYEEALAGVSGDPLPVDGPAGAFMLYTSGTTGRPKGVERNMAGAGATAASLVAGMTVLGGALGVRPGGAHLVTGPLYHAAPLGFSTMAFNLGATLVLMDRWTPEDCLAQLTEHRVTSTHLVPTMFIRLLRLSQDKRDTFDPSWLQCVLHGAAPCPAWAKKAMIDWWGPVITEYYGATEGGITTIGAEDWLEHPGSVGRPLPVYAAEARGDQGEVLPVGETGTIYFRSLLGTETFRYHNDEAKTAAAHAEPGVFTLGDVGHVDEDGYVWLTDRKNDLIIAGGVNIYPAEVEQVLSSHPALADVAVFGIPNEEWGEEVKAAVELLPGHEPTPELAEELIEHCRSKLAAYKCPRSVDFEDELPRHPTGKLYKRLLRDRYWAGSGRLI
jgi:long-chain acyl-CoA synthetase